MQSLIGEEGGSCRHTGIREIWQDYDKNGRPVRLVRCQRCGLLMRMPVMDEWAIQRSEVAMSEEHER